MNWVERLLPSQIRTETKPKKKSIPEGLWEKCPSCQSVLYVPELDHNLRVCHKCDHHLRLGARARLLGFLDEDGREEIGQGLLPEDVLKFKDSKRYKDRYQQAQKKTGEQDAMVVMSGTVEDVPVVAAAFEFGFMGGSMGSVVGERFYRATRACLDRECALVCFSASGGARMQESLFSLMQMAKTSSALQDMAEARLPFVSVLTDPTMGGVSASLAMLGDVHLAEPGALIGFAGPRVIEQTVRETLPEGFQRSEFLLEHGALDMIVPRTEMRSRIASTLNLLRANGG